MRNNKLILLIIIVILPFVFTGCWDYVEYEDMALISAVGIDSDDAGRITVTLQYLIPGGSQNIGSGNGSGGEGGSSKSGSDVAIITATGPTILDALTRIQEYLDKKLFYGYMEVLILGENAAQDLLMDFMGLNDRTPQLRTTVQFAVVEGRAQDAVCTVESNITTPPGHYLREMIEKSGAMGGSSAVIIQDFIEYMEEEGIEPVAPRIKTYTTETAANAANSVKPGDGTSRALRIKPKEGYHSVDGMAVIKHEKLVGWLDSDETKGFSWITGKRMSAYESHKTIQDAESKEILNYRISKSKSRIKAGLENGKPTISINVYVESVDLRKYAKNMEAGDLTPEAVDQLQKYLEATVRSEIGATLKKVQRDLKTDIFGFGQVFYRKYPSLWHSAYKDKWDEIFPDIPVTVNVKAKLLTTGTTIKKFELK